jgi:hypothetical protein
MKHYGDIINIHFPNFQGKRRRRLTGQGRHDVPFSLEVEPESPGFSELYGPGVIGVNEGYTT